jgi:hypothetical protein
MRVSWGRRLAKARHPRHPCRQEGDHDHRARHGPVRAGCIDYCYAVDLKDADCLHVIEAWRDEAAVEAYLDDLGGLLAILAGAEMQTPQVNAYEGRFFKVIMGDGPSD